jgi:hypothetical protein
MSLNFQAPQKSDGLAVSLLAFPFIVIEAAGSRVMAALTKKSNHRPKAQAPSAPTQKSVPDITANQQYMIADRVFSARVRDRNVSFYQYFAANVIRINCRELRHLKPIDFTPAVAESAALVYDIDGAIQWVRKNGLESDPATRGPSKAESRPNKGTGQTLAPAGAPEDQSKTAKSAVPTASTTPMNIVPATGNKSAPFTGRIVSFGITKRTGVGDKKPYTTYAMKLQSESGAYEKEFIGEHLSDLVTDMGLYVHQLVRIQLLGKHHFEVEVDGKMQSRSRNHFEIQPL